MPRKIFRAAVSLPELIFAMVILGMVVVTMMGALTTVARNAAFSEDTSRLSFFAESLMEDVTGKRFDENANAPWSTLGRDGAETAGNSLSYDDVDDYIGTTDPLVISPASGFKRSVNVTYASLSGSSWVANISPNAATNPYKLITVTANRANGSVKVTLVGIKGAN